MSHGLLGKKIGMTQIFDDTGNKIPVTVLELGPNQVVQVKTAEGKDGYNAIKVGFDKVDVAKLNRPLAGVFHRAGVEAYRHVREFRVGAKEIADFTTGDELTAALFKVGQVLDVTGISKGCGYAGVVKKYGFKGAKEASHGTHEHKRHAGSIGCSAWPARVIKGKRMPGHMGVNRVTQRNVKVVAVHQDENLVLVKGSVPGGHNGVVIARPTRS